MHILFLTDNFPPEVNAPASRTYEHCKEWVRRGHKVSVITCAPNFPKGVVFEGYSNKLWQREQIDGIRVIRVWSYIAANEGFAKRILDYLSFMISAVFSASFVRNVDVVIGTSPQFFTACAAYAVSKIKSIPWIFELRDIWPESIRAVGVMKESLVLDFLENIEVFLYRKSSLIISVTNAFRETLVKRGVDGDKINVVTNGVDLGRYFPQSKDYRLVEQLNLNDKFIVGYIGTHGLAHALDTILDAAKILQRAPYGAQFQFIFVGDGASKEGLVGRVSDENINNVIFIDTVSKDEVVRYWSLLDVSVIHLKNSELFSTVIPSKLFESMGMGVPVLHGVKGESAEIVNKEGVGITFEPESTTALCNALLRCYDNPDLCEKFKVNGMRSATKYDRVALASGMLDLIDKLVE